MTARKPNHFLRLSRNACYLETCFVPVFRALFLSGMAALGFRQLLLILVKEFGITHDFARREDDKGLQTKIGTTGGDAGPNFASTSAWITFNGSEDNVH